MNERFDEVLLTQLRDLFEAEFPEMVRLFLRDSNAELQNVTRAMEQGSLDATRRHAHSLKGSCRNVGAIGLAACWGELEDAALAAASGDTLRPLLEAAQQEQAAVVEELQRRFLGGGD